MGTCFEDEAPEAKPAPKQTSAPQKKRSKRADVVVTARVPVEIRDRGNAILKSIGSTPTELVNAAYSYVIEHGELPRAQSSLADTPEKKRRLSPEQSQKIRERNERITFEVPESFWEETSDEELLVEALEEQYESLA